MNAAIRAVAKIAVTRGLQVVGAQEGYDGLIDGKFRELTRESSDGTLSVDLEVDVAASQGGTILGSARCLRFKEPPGRVQAMKNLREQGADGLVVIGGNGSLTGAHILSQEHGVKVMGIPGSIDNDIGCTSTCLGVDTALNTIVEACDRIGDTARAHRRVFMVEVMGRDSGYLAMASAVALGADGVLLREQGRSEERLVEDVKAVVRAGFKRGKRRILIIKAEGVQVPCTRLVRLASEQLLPELPGLEMRATVLGHIVRGGNPSYQDRLVAGRLGFAAVLGLIEGASDEMVAWRPMVQGGAPTFDNAVERFSLSRVLKETEALLDGSSPITQRRVELMARAAGVLSL